jgi:hypothetical protein
MEHWGCYRPPKLPFAPGGALTQATSRMERYRRSGHEPGDALDPAMSFCDAAGLML